MRFDYAKYLDAFEETAARCMLVGETVTTTPDGPLRIWRSASQTPGKPCGFLSAGIHGDEPAGPLALLEFLRGTSLPPHRSWVLAPALNPTGLVRGTRENASGIDLNRDFLQRRSEEVAALTRWWSAQPEPCCLHVSLHEDWEAEGLYVYTLNTTTTSPFAQRLVNQLDRAIALQKAGPVDDHTLAAPGLILHEPDPDEPEGWPEAIWLVKRAPTASYTLEAPGAFTPAERVRALHHALALTLQLDAEDRGEA